MPGWRGRLLHTVPLGRSPRGGATGSDIGTSIELGGRRICFRFSGLTPHRGTLFPHFPGSNRPTSLPEWTVSVLPLGTATFATGGDESSVMDGFAAHFPNSGDRTATFFIDPSRRKKDLDARLAFGVYLILRREGRLDLHAAAVAPARDAGALLIIGPKGAGKSSLTMALALSGWTLFSDDHIITWRDGGELRVAGLRVPLFLTPDAAERLPSHLPKGRMAPSLGKRMFQPEELFPGQHRAEGPVARTVFIERSAAPSKLEPLRPLDCFQRLLSVSPFLASDPSARPCIEIARGIADLPSFALHAGPDILQPTAADALLRGALA